MTATSKEKKSAEITIGDVATIRNIPKKVYNDEERKRFSRKRRKNAHGKISRKKNRPKNWKK